MVLLVFVVNVVSTSALNPARVLISTLAIAHVRLRVLIVSFTIVPNRSFALCAALVFGPFLHHIPTALLPFPVDSPSLPPLVLFSAPSPTLSRLT